MESSTAKPRIIRSQIYKDMAFPVGYQLLHEHFGALVDSPGTQLWFSAHHGAFASDFARVLRSGEAYRIFEISRRSRSFHQYISNAAEPAHWELHVYPVRSELKSVARAAILDSVALASAHDFVARCPTHDHYGNVWNLIFAPGDGTFTTTVGNPL